jgi:hypothetical protein
MRKILFAGLLGVLALGLAGAEAQARVRFTRVVVVTRPRVVVIRPRVVVPPPPPVVVAPTAVIRVR